MARINNKVSFFLKLDGLISSLWHWSPLSEIHCDFWFIIENGTNLLLNLWGPLVVKLKGLKIFLNLSEFGESKNASANISTSNSPC